MLAALRRDAQKWRDAHPADDDGGSVSESKAGGDDGDDEEESGASEGRDGAADVARSGEEPAATPCPSRSSALTR